MPRTGICACRSPRPKRWIATSGGCARSWRARRPRSSCATTRGSWSGSRSCWIRSAPRWWWARSTAGSSCPDSGCSPITRSSGGRGGCGGRGATAKPSPARPLGPCGAATSWSISSTASGSTVGSRRSPSARRVAVSRSPWSSTKAAPASTSRCIGSTNSSRTGRRVTARRRRRGSTGWARRRGNGSATRRARRFAGWRRSCSISTRGEVDIVIGTHRLLSRDVTFHDLGLLIVDEEHRFGVRHKERLKALKLAVDVLTLTATPIPRTLHLSLAGLRDLTLLETPPKDRSPVVTFIEPWDDGLIEEALARELDRAGQVYFVHNRIETIDTVAERVRSLAPPRARVAVAHGKLKEAALDDVMAGFVRGEVDILVSTMIVESGLDVPHANTMLVSRADQLGLAQLYQLRGRVGRSHRRAYCYLLVPDLVDAEADERLRVLEHHTDLGSGYRIALRDLELRGAGNLLGAEQSGYAQAVGFDTYLRWLQETVEALKTGDGERGAGKGTPPEVVFDQPAHLSDDYVSDEAAKLELYRRLARAEAPSEIEAVREELRDRFGPLPDDARRLLLVSELRALGARAGLEMVLVKGDEARLTFRRDATPRLARLTAALDAVQFEAEVRRAAPLSLRLRRIGGEAIGPGLVRALSAVLADAHD